jgi:hypothetical protein
LVRAVPVKGVLSATPGYHEGERTIQFKRASGEVDSAPAA